MSEEEQAVLEALARTILEAGVKANARGEPVEVRIIVEPGGIMKASLHTRFSVTDADPHRVW